MRARSSAGLDPELDARLVERCRAGDARAWAALVKRYERLVYAVARGYRLEPEDLADTFQEVFAALVKGLPRLRDARSLCRWLTSTTDRIALAAALRRRRERARDAGPADELDAPPAVADPTGADLESLEDRMLVRLALGTLAARCKGLLEALYLRAPEVAYREIAAELGIPIGSIGPTRARCLERLKAALALLESPAAGISGEARPTSPDERGPVRRASTRTAGGPAAPTPAPNRREDLRHVN